MSDGTDDKRIGTEASVAKTEPSWMKVRFYLGFYSFPPCGWLKPAKFEDLAGRVVSKINFLNRPSLG